MRKEITKQILRDVESYLDEVDIEGMIETLTSTEAVNRKVKEMLAHEIANMIQNKIVKRVQEKQPLIDAWTSNKITSLLIELGLR